jgi:hypothetical protein
MPTPSASSTERMKKTNGFVNRATLLGFRIAREASRIVNAMRLVAPATMIPVLIRPVLREA